MDNNTKIELNYIPGKRFVVEIKDEDSGRLFYTKRFRTEGIAFNVRDEYNMPRSMSAKVCDTKTGEMY